MAQKKWIQKATAKMKQKGTVGALTAQAKSKGMTVKQFCAAVGKGSIKISGTTKKRCAFAKNANKGKKKKKKG
jgi:hypothetical protein